MTKVKQVEVIREDSGIRLDRWFKRNYPDVGHVAIEKALRKGQIRVDGKKAKAGQHVEAGQIIRVPPFDTSKRELPSDKPKKYEIGADHVMVSQIQKSVVYKDKDIIVINKPHGLATQGGTGIKISVDSLLDYLKFESEDRPKLVHRLDKDTSGLLVLARKTAVASKLGEAFRNKNMEKVYWAIVVGSPRENEGKIDLPIIKREVGEDKEKIVVDRENGQKAVTYFRVLERFAEKMAFVELMPITGRTHQLRVHMAEMGTPILGDGKYGGKAAFVEGLSNKLHLHARKLALPIAGGKGKQFVADLSDHMLKTFKYLGIEKK